MTNRTDLITDPALPRNRSLGLFRWSSVGESIDGTLVIDGENCVFEPDQVFAAAVGLRAYGDIRVTNVGSPKGHAVALAISAALYTPLIIEDDANGSPEGVLVVSPEMESPPKLEEHRRPVRMHPDFPVNPPLSLGNDYLALTAKARTRAIPHIPVSVVLPVYNRTPMLRRTVACLAHQTYPLDLMEIIVADDGSNDHPETVLEEFEGVFGAMQYVRQDDDGFRVARIRNIAIDSASHSSIILFDADMAPVPRAVELHMRHLAVEPDAVYVGNRRYVDASSVNSHSVVDDVLPMLRLPDIRPNNSRVTIEDETGPSVDWRLAIYHQTAGLRFDPHPFRIVAGGNLAFTKSTFEKAGPFDTAFQAWGGEDLEWGYRAWNTGSFIVPVVDACGLHQEPPGGSNDTDRESGQKQTHPLLIDRVPARYRAQAKTPYGHSVPMVSVYIPAFNAEQTIGLAVQSVLDQTYADIEVCVVDDGSSDATAELVRSMSAVDQRVRLLSQPNSGIGAASQAAVSMCRAPFIGQLDSDDILKPNAVARLLPILRKDPRIGVVYSSSELIDEHGERIGDAYEFPEYNRYHLMYGMIVHHFKLFRARDWYRTDGFALDIENAVDFDMYLKMAEVTEMLHVPEQLYQYRRHKSSTSRAKHDMQRANHRLVVQRSLDRCGLSRDWEISPRRPSDNRTYEFVQREGPGLSFGNTLSRVRLSIAVGWKRDEAMVRLRDLCPSWRLRKRKIGGEPRIHTQPMSHARAIKWIPEILQVLPSAEVHIVHL